MGTNRKPTSQKVLQGTFRADQEQEIPEPQIPSSIRTPPAYMGKCGRQLWRDLAEELVDLGMLTVLDWTTLELCCNAYDLYRETQEGITRPSNAETGRPKRRKITEYLQEEDGKLLKIMNQQYDRYMTAVKAMGLSPAARKGIVIPDRKTEEISEIERQWNELLNGQ